MPPLAQRIEYRNGSNQIIADAEASADGLTLRAFDSTGALMASLQVNPQGRLDVDTGGATIALANGLFEVNGDIQLGGQVRGQNLPSSDPLDYGKWWNDNGTLKVSAG